MVELCYELDMILQDFSMHLQPFSRSSQICAIYGEILRIQVVAFYRECSQLIPLLDEFCDFHYSVVISDRNQLGCRGA